MVIHSKITVIMPAFVTGIKSGALNYTTSGHCCPCQTNILTDELDYNANIKYHEYETDLKRPLFISFLSQSKPNVEDYT